MLLHLRISSFACMVMCCLVTIVAPPPRPGDSPVPWIVASDPVM